MTTYLLSICRITLLVLTLASQQILANPLSENVLHQHCRGDSGYQTTCLFTNKKGNLITCVIPVYSFAFTVLRWKALSVFNEVTIIPGSNTLYDENYSVSSRYYDQVSPPLLASTLTIKGNNPCFWHNRIISCINNIFPQDRKKHRVSIDTCNHSVPET